MNDYDIDYDIFSYEEIGIIISFFVLVEESKTKRIKKDILKERYKEYRNVVNSISLEKKYDKMLEKRCGVSIYRLMKSLQT